jgi:hypothetical protein
MLREAGYEIIVELGSKVNGHALVLYDVAHQLRSGCHVGFVRLWLLAEAKGKSPRRKAEIKTIVREFEVSPREAIMHEVATNRFGNVKADRDGIIADALEDVTKRAQGRRSAENGKQSAGRPRKPLTPDVLRTAELVWRNTKTYRSWSAAGAKLPKGMTTRDAYNMWGSRKKQDNK